MLGVEKENVRENNKKDRHIKCYQRKEKKMGEVSSKTNVFSLSLSLSSLN